MTFSIVTHSTMAHNIEYCYAKCRDLLILTLIAMMLSVVMLIVTGPSAVMLNVVAPFYREVYISMITKS